MDEVSTLRLRVISQQNMHCKGCERTAEFTLARVPGVMSVKADYKTQIIEVNMADGEGGIDKVKTELEWIGYEIEVA